MEITHVFRGEEHLTNTPKQLMLYEMFGWEAPSFAHMTLIINEDRKKLSKRDESIIQFVSQYKEMGYLPEAMFNFFALLGWSPEGEQEILSKEVLIKDFDVTRLSKSPSMFDKNKLTYLNNRYIKEAPLEKVVEIALPHLILSGKINENLSEVDKNWAENLIALYQDQMSYGAEIVELSELFFKDELVLDEESEQVMASEHVPATLEVFKNKIAEITDFSAEEVNKAIKETQKESGQKGKNLFMPIRISITGQMHGPDLPKAIALLGKDKVIERINKFLG
jgi:nondiscriminating glutamyl-tRNA synthetase